MNDESKMTQEAISFLAQIKIKTMCQLVNTVSNQTQTTTLQVREFRKICKAEIWLILKENHRLYLFHKYQ